ncbi:MAG: ABC transporter permease subunit, partial [Gaiellales bacterium]
VVAFAGVTLPLLVGSTMIVEVIFRFEGLGFHLVNAVLKRDFPLAQTLGILFTAFVILCNLLADVGHQMIDPRVRERARTGGL